LYDLWKDAIEATPGSDYIHIGSDETYELGACEQCKAKSEELGRKRGFTSLFINKAADYLKTKGRKGNGVGNTNGMEDQRISSQRY